MKDCKSHWERIYQGKSPPEMTWHQQEPALSLELVRNAQVAKNERIIDIGGGASTLVDQLINAKYSRVSVLDISENALACSRERLGDLQQKAEWYTTDITEFKPPHQFSLWHDRAVFHFLTRKSDRVQYVTALKAALKPGGTLIIATFAIGGPERCSGFDIVQYDKKKLAAVLGEEFELKESREESHITPAGHAQKFTYFRFIRNPDLENACKN